MTIDEAQKLILQTIKNVMEEKITNENVEVMIVRTNTKKIESMKGPAIDAILETLA